MARPSRSRGATRRPDPVPARSAVLVVLLAGLVAVLVGLGVVALNEPTQLPDLATGLVVQTHAQVTGERTLALGVALLMLALGFRLGAGLRPARRTPTRRPTARSASTGRSPRQQPARKPAVTRGTPRTRTGPRKTASK